MSPFTNKRSVYSWAMYDWANSVFATVVMSGFFPIFFKKYWASGIDTLASTKYLGSANSIAGLSVALIAPILGAIADNSTTKKHFLFIFALLGIVTTALLYTVGMGDWLTAATYYSLASVGFVGSMVFYDSMIIRISNPSNIDRISVLGYALGYLGGGILFAVNVLMFLKPEIFGISSSSQAIKISFLTVAVWWTIFSLPLLFFVDDHNPKGVSLIKSIIQGLKQLYQTLSELKNHRNVVFFLLSYWVYIDGVHTIVVMAADYGMNMGIDHKHLMGALLMVQFIGFPAALSFTLIAEKFNAKFGILIALICYTVISVYAFWLDTAVEFYILAAGVGLVQGGIQSLSRSLFGSIIPKERATQFFGLYNMMGKFAAIIGPLIVGFVGTWTGDQRLSLPFISIMFIGGIFLLLKVKVSRWD